VTKHKMSSMIGGTTMTTLLIVLILGSAQNQFPNTNSFATSARKGSIGEKKKKKKGVHLAIIATAINKFKSKIILAQVGPILKKWLI